jgi:hypothetical protein
LTKKCKYAEEHTVYNTTKGFPESERQYVCTGTKELDVCPCENGIKNKKCSYWKEDSVIFTQIKCKDCRNFQPFSSDNGQCDKYGLLKISPDFYCASAEAMEKTRCSLCYSDNPEGSRFCNKCGERL